MNSSIIIIIPPSPVCCRSSSNISDSSREKGRKFARDTVHITQTEEENIIENVTGTIEYFYEDEEGIAKRAA